MCHRQTVQALYPLTPSTPGDVLRQSWTRERWSPGDLDCSGCLRCWRAVRLLLRSQYNPNNGLKINLRNFL